MIALRKRQGSNYDAEDIGRRYSMTEDDWKALRAFETVLHAVAALRISTVVCGIVFAVNVLIPVSYTHLRAHETVLDLVCRLLLAQKNHNNMN